MTTGTAASVAALVFTGLLVRYAASLHPFSGQATPPMHGDFEAQRHWIEITGALPPSKWYVQSDDNDLQYWGLDYPPFTAFHSWALARVAEFGLRLAFRENPEAGSAVYAGMFGLRVSRGSEGQATVLFMRLSSLVSDLLVYFPFAVLLALFVSRAVAGGSSVVVASSTTATTSTTTTGPSGTARGLVLRWRLQLCTLGLLLIVLPLPLVLIDHGHFQYNAVSLGFFLGALLASAHAAEHPSYTLKGFLADTTVLALTLCSVYFKQMSLFYTPAVAFYLLGRVLAAVPPRQGFGSALFLRVLPSFVGHVATAALVTAAAFYPFVDTAAGSPPLYGAERVLMRVFPLGRGLYESKVSNVWCVLSLVWKLPSAVQRWLPPGAADEAVRRAVASTCAGVVFVAFLPACLGILRFQYHAARGSSVLRRLKQLARAASAASLAFYLFGFQVHEKSILVPLLPVSVVAVVTCAQWVVASGVAGGRSGDAMAADVYGAEFVFSVHFAAVALFSMYPLVVVDNLQTLYFAFLGALLSVSWFAAATTLAAPGILAGLGSISVVFSTLGMAGLHVLHVVWKPSGRFPDIVTMLFACYSCGHFVFYFLWCTFRCLADSGVPRRVLEAAAAVAAANKQADSAEAGAARSAEKESPASGKNAAKGSAIPRAAAAAVFAAAVAPPSPPTKPAPAPQAKKGAAVPAKGGDGPPAVEAAKRRSKKNQ